MEFLSDTQIKLAVKDIINVFKKYDAKAGKQYNALKAQFHKKYGDTKSKNGRLTFKALGTMEEANMYFDKAFLSNMQWDRTLYGVKGLDEDIDFAKWVAAKDKKTGRLINTQIGDSKGFNKRNQIWMTDGFELDSPYFQEIYKDMGGDIPIANDRLKFRLFADPGKNPDLTSNSPSRLYTEVTDGEILMEETVLNALNKAWGLPESGQNKTFIVDNDPNHGAFLGKMMFHKANAEASKWMRENNLHMLVPESAAKEFGSRKVGEFQLVKIYLLTLILKVVLIMN